MIKNTIDSDILYDSMEQTFEMLYDEEIKKTIKFFNELMS